MPYFALTGIEGQSLLATFVVALSLLGLGHIAAALHRQRSSAPEDLAFDLAVGWGVATVFMEVAALLHLPLAGSAIVIMVVGLCGFAFPRAPLEHRRRERGLFVLLAILLLPLLIIAVVTPPVMYDEMGHWLPNARFVFEHNVLPSGADPNVWSDIPSYPYGGPFINEFASVLMGRWLEAPIKLFTVLLYGALALAWIHAVIGERARVVGVGSLAIAIAVFTIFNPTFDPRIALTTYMDSPSAALLALLALSSWRAVASAADGRVADGRCWSYRSGYVALALVVTRDTNIVLIAGVGWGVLVAAAPLLWRQPKLSCLAIWLVAPPLTGFLLWRLYRIVAALPPPLPILPLGKWQWDAIQIVVVAAFRDRLPAHPLLGGGALLVSLLLGLMAVWTIRRSEANDRRLMVIVGMTTMVWLVFLGWAYIGTMTPRDVGIAMSFWRYTGQLGPLLLVAALPFLRQFFNDRILSRFFAGMAGTLVGVVAIATLLVVPIASASHWRNDCNIVDSVGAREIVAALASELASADRILIVHTEYSQWLATDTAYVLHRPLEQIRWLDAPAEMPIVEIATGADDRVSLVLDLRPLNRGAIYLSGNLPAVTLYRRSPGVASFEVATEMKPTLSATFCKFPSLAWR